MSPRWPHQRHQTLPENSFTNPGTCEVVDTDCRVSDSQLLLQVSVPQSHCCPYPWDIYPDHKDKEMCGFQETCFPERETTLTSSQWALALTCYGKLSNDLFPGRYFFSSFWVALNFQSPGESNDMNPLIFTTEPSCRHGASADDLVCRLREDRCPTMGLATPVAPCVSEACRRLTVNICPKLRLVLPLGRKDIVICLHL